LRAVFSSWLRALRQRPTVAIQMAAPYAVSLLAIFLAGVSSTLSGAAAAALVVFTVAVILALLAFTLGAALGAAGEAIRGDAPTGYLARGRLLFWRTLGTIGFAILIALPTLIVAIIGFALILAAAFGAAFGASGAAAPAQLGLILLGVALLFAILSTPIVYSMEAGVFVGGRTAPQAFRSSFSDAYRGGRIWRWLLCAIIISVLGLAGSLLGSISGVPGAILGLVASAVVLWLGSTLAFANWYSDNS
jgi:hypothetical protein